MSWLGIVVAIVGAWLAFKVIGALLKGLFWIVALVGLYWFAAPHLGLPPLMQLLS